MESIESEALKTISPNVIKTIPETGRCCLRQVTINTMKTIENTIDTVHSNT